MLTRALLLTTLTALALVGCDSGQGLATEAPRIELAPNPVVFDTVPLGTIATRPLTISNTGTWPLSVTELSVGGEGFRLAESPGPFTLAPSAHRDVGISFVSQILGPSTGIVRVRSDDPDHPVSEVELRATRREGPVLVVCLESEDAALARTCDGARTLDVGAVPIEQSRIGTITLRSEGSEALEVRAAALTGDAAWTLTSTETWPKSLAPGAEVRLRVIFHPSTIASSAAQLDVTSDDPLRSSVRVDLHGQAVAPSLCVDPITVDFGLVRVGSSAERKIQLKNCGTTSVSASGFEIFVGQDEFSVVDPPTAPVLLGSTAVSYELRLRYRPTTTRSSQGRLRIRSTRSDVLVDLRGQAGDCDLEVSPSYADLTFGVGAATFNVHNAGPGPCLIRDVRLSSDSAPGFMLHIPPLPPPSSDPPFPYSLESGQSFMAQVSFEPQSVPAGQVRGKLLVLSEGSTRAVDLTGQAEARVDCTFHKVLPRALRFGDVDAGQRRILGVELSPLTVPCRLGTVGLDGATDPAFSLVGGPPAVLAGPTVIDVAYRSEQPRAAQGALVVTPPTGPAVTVPLSATTGATGLCVDPTNLDFGEVSAPSTRSIQLVACAGRAVTVTDLHWLRPDAELSLDNPPALPLSLAAGAMTTLVVRYAPTDAIGDTAVLEVVSDDPGHPRISVRMTGGRAVVPPSAGRFLYFWGGPTGPTQIYRLGLQGSPVPELFDGPPADGSCSGCHAVSPDGRFVAVHRFEDQDRRIIIRDTLTGTIAIGPGSWAVTGGSVSSTSFSWNPNIHTDPPYQYAYAKNGDIYLASLYTGELGILAGASEPDRAEGLPSWGPNGQIAFTRADTSVGPTMDASTLEGPTSLYLVSESGGVATPIPGASLDGASNYHPSFSPNGAWIAFARSGAAVTTISAPDGQVRVVKADQSGTVKLLPRINTPPGGVPASWPTWSLDGNYLSFSSSRRGGSGSWDVYIAPFDPATGEEGDPRSMTELNSPGFEHGAQWSP